MEQGYYFFLLFEKRAANYPPDNLPKRLKKRVQNLKTFDKSVDLKFLKTKKKNLFKFKPAGLTLFKFKKFEKTPIFKRPNPMLVWVMHLTSFSSTQRI
ncbi:MAG: hypothetical protein CM15mP83_9770 [Flavobacteriaceae bacterium]|nr:MAG: hypothetical protein CM15mP83_9770 [Flavobacteriaceae bacterium]